MTARAPHWVLILGWVFAVFGGFIGIGIGAHLRYAKITAPNGEKIFRYNDNARRQGLIILVLGIVAMIGWTAFNAAMR
jgi:hypothetical protein